MTIFEDWNERDGQVFYRWKRIDENGDAEEGEWHEQLTAYKQKPTIIFKRMSKFEYHKNLAPNKSI